MPLCIYCRAQAMDFVELPDLNSVSLLPWLTAYDLDASALSADGNVMCRSHVRDLDKDPRVQPQLPEVSRQDFVAVRDSAQDQGLQQVLSSMGNVSVKGEHSPGSGSSHAGIEGRSAGDCVQAAGEPGSSGSEEQSNALPIPPGTPTQVCDVTSTTPTSGSEVEECPVCLQPPQLPIKLPCNHIFCFLCAKGFANQLGRCAYCRTQIPVGYMNLPTVVPRSPEEEPSPDTKRIWYYEGRQGWWQFEERHCQELEEALARGDSQYDLQISGFMYVMDLDQMVQYRRDRPGRTRKIKRDTVTAPRKGVAGLREDLINASLI